MASMGGLDALLSRAVLGVKAVEIRPGSVYIALHRPVNDLRIPHVLAEVPNDI